MTNFKMNHFLSIIITLICFLLFSSSATLADESEKIEKTIPVSLDKELSIIFHVDAGSVNISANNEPDKISLNARYFPDHEKIDIEFDEKKNELNLYVDRDKWLKHTKENAAAQITVFLPYDATILIDTDIKAGEIEYDFGGLKISEFELHSYAGEVTVNFPEPNKIEMSNLEVDLKIGETDLRNLGNARFRNANINGGIGELSLDFSGVGSEESKVDIDLEIGETNIMIPKEIGVRFKCSTLGFLTDKDIDNEFHKDGRYYYSNNYESAKNSMQISISSGIGELRVRYR